MESADRQIVSGGARPFGHGIAIAAALCVALGAGAALAADGEERACDTTAAAQFFACRNEVADDLYTAKAACINVSDAEERAECFAEADEEGREAQAECREQLVARRELCEALGGGRYDPDFDPASFDDDFEDLTSPNPYFPLGIGNRWEYANDEEHVHVEVLDKTKLIEGVTCVVVNDRVEVDGRIGEDTDDWFGHRKDGTVDYCGEISRNFETFEGDDPEEPELVDIDGSWKAGRDGALPGTLFPGSPTVGQVYRQEWAPGDAEDAARVLSTTYGYGSDPELDRFVPQALAELFCADDDCVVTGEFTPLEPGEFERKYYGRGIGLFLEVDPESGEILPLVGCSFDARCNAL
jgi:hypothetical protein